MPLFDFTNDRGHRREVLLPSAQDVIFAEGETWHRVKVAPFAFVGVQPAPSLGQNILAGYRTEELKQGSRFRSRHHHETVKRVWKNDAGHE